MRVLCLRAFSFVALPLILITSQHAPTAAQTGQTGQTALSRAAPYVPEPEIRTRIENLMAVSGRLVATDYYRIDMRSGPNVRIDAVVVTVVDSQTCLKGLRVQVRDDANPSRHAGESFLDLDEAVHLSRALASMTALARKWTGLDDRRAAQLSFASAGGLRLSVREFGRVQRVEVSTGLTDPVAASIEFDDLLTLKHAFDQALALLNEK